MSITHHLDDATLMSYAAGSLPGALAAVASVHLAMCQHCRRELALAESIGASLMEGLAPVALEPSGPPAPTVAPKTTEPPSATAGDLPAPLARLIGGSLDDVRWTPIGPGVWHSRLDLPRTNGIVRLLNVTAGRNVPEHGHEGSELTLVLRGAFEDVTGRYGAGDVADLDDTVEHQPVADTQTGCICLVASEKPARFRGLLARLLQPWHGL
jgi:putative transcriptional regulator